MGDLDQGYRGKARREPQLIEGSIWRWSSFQTRSGGYVALPRGWVMEMSFDWTSYFRRLDRNDERLASKLMGTGPFVDLRTPEFGINEGLADDLELQRPELGRRGGSVKSPKGTQGQPDTSGLSGRIVAIHVREVGGDDLVDRSTIGPTVGSTLGQPFGDRPVIGGQTLRSAKFPTIDVSAVETYDALARPFVMGQFGTIGEVLPV